MSTKENQELPALIGQATAGDKSPLETVLAGVQDLVFNLALRMLGTFHDAEDPSQNILLKVMTHLSSCKGESPFTAWVFRIVANHLRDCKKHMFAQFPLSFEFYGEDIRNGNVQDVPDPIQNVESAILAEKLKLSCTNVMLQCLDPESWCIFCGGRHNHGGDGRLFLAILVLPDVPIHRTVETDALRFFEWLAFSTIVQG